MSEPITQTSGAAGTVQPTRPESHVDLRANGHDQAKGASENLGSAEPAPSATRWWRDARRRRALALADVVAVMTASALFVPGEAGYFWALVFVPVWLLLAKALGNYDRDHRSIRHLTIDEVPQVLAWAALGTLAVSAYLELTPVADVHATGEALLFSATALGALVLRSLVRLGWRETTPPERTTLIGNGTSAEAIRRKLTLLTDMNAEVVHRVDPPAPNASDSERKRFLRDVVGSSDRIILATDTHSQLLIAELRDLCRRHEVKLSVVSVLSGRAQPIPNTSQIADLRVLEYDTWDISRTTIVFKRIFDLSVSTALVILASPLMLLAAIAIKLDSRGPVLFSQPRAGLAGKPFWALKFRTMCANAEELLPNLVCLETLEDPVFKLRDDPRVTRVGRFLRRFSLDELPQLINVIRGDMSIVGPRPEQVELVERYEPEQRFRLEVKPGITGPMQVNGRAHLTFTERLAVELDYVENLSLARDLRLLALTLPAVARQHGAF